MKKRSQVMCSSRSGSTRWLSSFVLVAVGAGIQAVYGGDPGLGASVVPDYPPILVLGEPPQTAILTITNASTGISSVTVSMIELVTACNGPGTTFNGTNFVCSGTAVPGEITLSPTGTGADPLVPGNTTCAGTWTISPPDPTTGVATFTPPGGPGSLMLRGETPFDDQCVITFTMAAAPTATTATVYSNASMFISGGGLGPDPETGSTILSIVVPSFVPQKTCTLMNAATDTFTTSVTVFNTTTLAPAGLCCTVADSFIPGACPTTGTAMTGPSITPGTSADALIVGINSPIPDTTCNTTTGAGCSSNFGTGTLIAINPICNQAAVTCTAYLGAPPTATCTANTGTTLLTTLMPVTTAPVTCGIPPNLTVVKTDSVNGMGILNVPFTWTITVSDSGGLAVFGAGTVLTDSLPNPGLTYGTPTSSNSAVVCTITSFTLTCTTSTGFPLAPGSSFTVSFTATPTAAGTYPNTCIVFAPTNGSAPTGCSNTVTVPQQMTGIKLKKIFVSTTTGLEQDSVVPGSKVAVTFTIIDQGAVPLTDVAFSDTFPTDLTHTSPAASNTCGGTLTVHAGDVSLMGGGPIAVGGSCTVTVNLLAGTLTPPATTPLRVCDTTSSVTSDQLTGSPATACITIGNAPIAPLDAYQVLYSANLLIGDSIINVSNSGAIGSISPFTPSTSALGDVCINAYVFDPDEEMIACCACLVTPDALNSFSVLKDLINNPLTLPPKSEPNGRDSVVIKLLTNLTDPGTCNATPNFQNLMPGGIAWATTLEPSVGWRYPVDTNVNDYGVVRVRAKREALSSAELNALTSACSFVKIEGSNFGICGSCPAQPGALSGAKR